MPLRGILNNNPKREYCLYFSVYPIINKNNQTNSENAFPNLKFCFINSQVSSYPRGYKRFGNYYSYRSRGPDNSGLYGFSYRSQG